MYDRYDERSFEKIFFIIGNIIFLIYFIYKIYEIIKFRTNQFAKYKEFLDTFNFNKQLNSYKTKIEEDEELENKDNIINLEDSERERKNFIFSSLMKEREKDDDYF